MTPEFAKTIPLHNLDIYVEKYGASGPEIVFIHGGPDWDHTYFLPFVLPLAETCQLYFYDLRGCGKSTRFGDSSKYQLAYNAEDLHELLRALGLNKPTLLGFSYGGGVLLEFITRYPNKAGKLILASASAYGDYQADLTSWNEYRERYTSELKQEMDDMLKSTVLSWEEKTRQLAAYWMPLMFYKEADEKQYSPKIMATDFSGEWIAAWQKGLLTDRPNSYADSLAKSATPLLILHGEKDMIFPASVAHRLHKELPNSHLMVIPQVGHMPHMEANNAWTQAVKEFVWS